MSARAVVVAAAFAGTVAFAQDFVHGSADAFAGPGIAMAWAVARGADETSTIVVVRIVADPSRHAWVDVRGIDPFTKAEQVLAAPRAIGRTTDVRIPRAAFADTPRTEWRLYPSDAAAREGKPGLVVYYLGVPDTTPEFGDAAKLDAYLAARTAK